MIGKVIGFIIVLIVIILINLYDFDRLLNGGTSDYIQRYSGMLITLCLLFFFVIIFDIKQIESIIILYVSYIAVYTLLYFKIIKIKKEREENMCRRRKNRK